MSFELGVNYWPRRRAMYMWRGFDSGEVRDDMARIAAMGFDTGAAGAYAWCYGDYHPRLFDCPPLDSAIRERSFGLVRADGSEKPAADVFRSFRKRRDAGQLVPPAPRLILDVSAEEYYQAPQTHFTRLYQRWVSGNTT